MSALFHRIQTRDQMQRRTDVWLIRVQRLEKERRARIIHRTSIRPRAGLKNGS
jgi:hypothetical protein